MSKHYWNLDDVKKFISVKSKFKVIYFGQPSLFQLMLMNMNDDVLGTDLIQGFVRYAFDDKDKVLKDTLHHNVILFTTTGIHIGKFYFTNKMPIISIYDSMKVRDFKSREEMLSIWNELHLMSGKEV